MDERLFFRILIFVVFFMSAVVFLVLVFVTAPYGRYVRKGWGARMNARWGWVVMELPAPLVFALCFIFGDGPRGLVPIIFIGMWELHYVHRSFLFPFLMRGGSTKQIPLLLVFFAITFNVINAYINGRYLFSFAPGYADEWIRDPRFIIGFLMFLMGFSINIHSDHLLRTLRSPGETQYKPPRGGFFRYVSGANYFGELMEWTGWAVATWSLPGLAFAVFTAANLIPRARSHHLWYRSRFPDYPGKRRAVIPFIY
jgi:3-oxo-5-alpha-steroid 4-dehydrogenase 1